MAFGRRHDLLVDGERIRTARLLLRPWVLDDAEAAPTEAGHAVAHYAFDAGLDEIFAVVRPQNVKGAATARRVGMERVGVMEKYYNLTLEVYRFRRGDLDMPILTSRSRTNHHEYSFPVPG